MKKILAKWTAMDNWVGPDRKRYLHGRAEFCLPEKVLPLYQLEVEVLLAEQLEMRHKIRIWSGISIQLFLWLAVALIACLTSSQ